MSKLNLCGVISGPTFEAACLQIKKASTDCNIVEFRIDLFDFKEIQELCSRTILPIIFTVRKVSQGGKYSGSETQRLNYLRSLLYLKPAYVDIESDVPLEFFEEFSLKTKVICSFHDFSETPKNLEEYFRNYCRKPASIYKFVTFARSSLDSFRMLKLVKKYSSDIELTGFCMGECGIATRILGHAFGNAITYVPMGEVIAPGQLTLDDLLHTYGIKSINSDTHFYGLIGNPVSQSHSDKTHNAIFRLLGVNAAYIKIPVIASELSQFLEHAASLNFKGWSLTMPLKETAFRLLKDLSPEAMQTQAVNTLVLKEKSYHGYNTDSCGAFRALNNVFDSLKNKKVVLIGAGGAAKGIAFALSNAGSKLIYFNRTLSKAILLSKQFGGKAYPLEAFNHFVNEIDYDILINTTSVGMNAQNLSPIDSKSLLSHKCVMEIISNPIETPLLIAAKQKNCKIIYGTEMFVYQALKQFTLWLESDKDKEIEEYFRSYFK